MSEPVAQPRPMPKGKAATQERILAAATALFMERGYEKTTVADVAQRAGVSRATVFWHFSDKGGLFREAFGRVLQPFRESLERDYREVPRDQRLQAQLAMGREFAAKHHDAVAAFVRWALESPEFREGVITTLLDVNQRFAGTLAQTISEVAPDAGDPQELAMGLMLAFDGNLLLSALEGRADRFAERDAAVTALVERIVGSAGK